MYKLVAALGALIGTNIAVKLLKIDLSLLQGSHLAESVVISIGLIAILSDLGFLSDKMKNNYLYLGLAAFLLGLVWEVLTFSSLLEFNMALDIAMVWTKISLLIIPTIGIPSLWIATRIAKEKKIFGLDAIGSKGLTICFLISMAYTIGMLYLLFHFNLLNL